MSKKSQTQVKRSAWAIDGTRTRKNLLGHNEALFPIKLRPPYTRALAKREEEDKSSSSALGRTRTLTPPRPFYFLLSPREESNPHNQLRRLVFYPLNYGEKRVAR